MTRWVSSWPEFAAEFGTPESRIVVLTGLDTKGLEFDGIVVVEPQEIEDESPTGTRHPLRRLHPRHPADGHADELTVLIHPWDEATREEWQEVLAHADFGQLVTAGHVDGFPVVVPDPLPLRRRRDTVLLHLARPNPVWQALEADPHVVLALAGDYTYVEAAWNANPGTDPTRGVPTSYYTGCSCSAAPRSSTTRTRRPRSSPPSSATSSRPTPRRATPTADDESDRRQLPGIRGLRLHVEGVRAKMKYGGNKTPEHRREIADHLAERDGPMDAAARQHLLRRLGE